MRLTAFETYLHERLPEGLSIKRLAAEIGVCRQTIYRRFLRAPWREGRGTFEGRFFSRLAVALFGGSRIATSELNRERNTLLWLSGYNPLVESDLSADDMLDLYETVERRAAELRSKREGKRGT